MEEEKVYNRWGNSQGKEYIQHFLTVLGSLFELNAAHSTGYGYGQPGSAIYLLQEQHRKKTRSGHPPTSPDPTPRAVVIIPDVIMYNREVEVVFVGEIKKHWPAGSKGIAEIAEAKQQIIRATLANRPFPARGKYRRIQSVGGVITSVTHWGKKSDVMLRVYT